MSTSAGTRDLQTYHLARLLHLVPHLHRVYAENCFLVPLFFSSVSPATKQHAKLILLCLSRRFGSPVAGSICSNIFSFLSFPELVVAPPVSNVGIERDLPVNDNVNDSGRGSGAPDASSSEETKPISGRKREREESELETRVRTSEDASESGVVKAVDSVGMVDSAGKDMHTQADSRIEPSLTSAAPTTSGGQAERSEELDRLFLVRPPVVTTPAALTQLYVRMTSEYQLNEETMNTYFGRYGQVSCVLVREQQVGDDRRSGGVSHVQDFIVTVDSMNNALQAVCYAYYRELTFIALHEPEYNVYTRADVDRVLEEVAVEVVEDPSKGADAAEGGDGGFSHHQSFIPDVVVDGLPYWLTVDQLRACFSEYGTVVDVRISIDDRSGSFTGAALLGMSSVEEAIAASEGLNGATLKGHTLVSGVLDARLNIVSLRHGMVVRRADEMLPEDYDLSENGRRWV